MIDTTKVKRSYAALPTGAWWQIRKKFQGSIPGKVTNPYIENVLNVGEGTARKVIVWLQTLGIVNEQEQVTDLGKSWRLDDHYAQACQTIYETAYTDELRSIAPGPLVDKNAASRWFQRTEDVGEAQANKYAALYAVIAEGNHAKEDGKSPTRKNGDAPKAVRQAVVRMHKATPEPEIAPAKAATVTVNPPTALVPTVHVDIQIHISPEANNDQIEKIFEAMGKHIFNRTQAS